MRSVAEKQELDEKQAKLLAGQQGRRSGSEGTDRGGRTAARLAEASTQELEEALLLRSEFSQGSSANKMGESEPKKQKIGDLPSFAALEPTILGLTDGEDDMEGREARKCPGMAHRPMS